MLINVVPRTDESHIYYAFIYFLYLFLFSYKNGINIKISFLCGSASELLVISAVWTRKLPWRADLTLRLLTKGLTTSEGVSELLDSSVFVWFCPDHGKGERLGWACSWGFFWVGRAVFLPWFLSPSLILPNFFGFTAAKRPIPWHYVWPASF